MGVFYQPGTGFSYQVDSIYPAVQHQIQLLLPVQIEQALHLHRQHGIRSVIGDVEQFLHRVLSAVIGVELDAHLPLVPSAVHVSVDGELHIAALVHVQNLDGMLIVHGTGIRVLRVIEAEGQSKLVGGDIVAEEPV